jgi:hypothetical protein
MTQETHLFIVMKQMGCLKTIVFDGMKQLFHFRTLNFCSDEAIMSL